MKHPSGLSQILLSCVLMVSLAVLLGASGAQESQPKPEEKKTPTQLIQSVKGPELFHAYCASCHGVDGKGNGPAAPALNTKPSDLTTIAQRNGGVFPTDRIRKVIAGDEIISAHGSQEMPVWGPIFHRVEWDQDLGDVRLQNVTKYLQSLQEK